MCSQVETLITGKHCLNILIYPLINLNTTKTYYYRCYIEQCDGNNTSLENKTWLEYAVPFSNQKPSKCYRYLPINITVANEYDLETCREDMFLKNMTERCNHFVYSTAERTILSDVSAINT